MCCLAAARCCWSPHHIMSDDHINDDDDDDADINKFTGYKRGRSLLDSRCICLPYDDSSSSSLPSSSLSSASSSSSTLNVWELCKRLKYIAVHDNNDNGDTNAAIGIIQYHNELAHAYHTRGYGYDKATSDDHTGGSSGSGSIINGSLAWYRHHTDTAEQLHHLLSTGILVKKESSHTRAAHSSGTTDEKNAELDENDDDSSPVSSGADPFATCQCGADDASIPLWWGLPNPDTFLRSPIDRMIMHVHYSAPLDMDARNRMILVHNWCAAVTSLMADTLPSVLITLIMDDYLNYQSPIIAFEHVSKSTAAIIAVHQRCRMYWKRSQI